MPCCCAVAFNSLEWAWARETWKWLIYITFSFLFSSKNTSPRESTATTIPPVPLDTDSVFQPVPRGARDFLSLVPVIVAVALPELLAPDSFGCATGDALLEFGRGEGSPSERWKGVSTEAANAVLAFVFRPGSTRVARSDEPLHLRRKTRQPSIRCTPVLSRSTIGGGTQYPLTSPIFFSPSL